MKLFLKWGYKPGYKKGRNVFSVRANGQMLLHEFDVFKAGGGNFDRTLTVELKDSEANRS